ncbi:MAG: siroheme synthase CysG [Pseudomonadota bacterium]
MRLFPTFFNMDDADIAVFGGGEEARRKVRLLVKTPARITVLVGDEIDEGFAEEFAGRITITPFDQYGPVLDVAKFAIIACRVDSRIEEAVTLARQFGVPINVVDHPELCDFIVPSILDRGEIVAAVATGGSAPVLAKSVRAKLEALMPKRIGELTRFARELRPAVYEAFDEFDARRQFWEAALNGQVAERFLEGDEEGALQAAKDMLAGDKPDGVVHIVGAGPGDPELLTLKALRLLQQADIVYYDRLVSADIIDLIRRDADRVCVGKQKNFHSVPQPKIHDLMVESAREGKRVVRLKGGDPFIFGRGGEELEALQAEGVDAHIVPGISSALGCAASAGVPLTHRDHAQAVTFVTGHSKSGEVPGLDWQSLGAANHTLVVFMGLTNAATIAENLIKAGRPPSTPVAVIENGTREDERRFFGRLSELPQLVSRNGVSSPALLIIGEVAGLSIDAIIHQATDEAA